MQTNVTLSWLQTESTKGPDGKAPAKEATKTAANGSGSGNQENKRKAIVFDKEGPPPAKKPQRNNSANGGGYRPGRQLYQAPRGGSGRFRSRW